jgi:DNA replication protein DnaC
MSGAGDRLSALASEFKLPTIASELTPQLVQADLSAALPVVLEVFEHEHLDRRNRRVERLRRSSKLPPGKSFESLDEKRLPVALQRQLRELSTGGFLDQATNVLCFGLPGTGKTHVACALGHRLVELGRPVLFTPAYRLVQQLLAAKRDLELPRALKKLDHFELLILDDIGYVRQSSEEVEVLFTLLSERYERKSMLVTSNLVFSDWDQIFQNPMTTASAIDRVVHHSVILEFDVASYRTQGKVRRKQAKVQRRKSPTQAEKGGS